jgi:hypothetical protein
MNVAIVIIKKTFSDSQKNGIYYSLLALSSYKYPLNNLISVSISAIVNN